MKSIPSILIIATLLFSLSSSLHLHHDILSHYKVDDYVLQLTTKQNNLAQQNTNLQNLIKTNQDAVDKETDLSKKIKLMEQSLQSQRKLLLDMAINTQADPISSEWVCAAISPEDKKSIANLTSSIKNDFGNLTQDVDNLNSNGSNCGPLKRDIDTTNQYVQNMKSPLDNANGQEVPVEKYTPSIFPNLDAPKWTLEPNYTRETLQNKYRSLSQNGPVGTCPLDQPYPIDGKSCEKCPDETPYFDVVSSKCILCIKFDPKTHSCQQSNQNIPESNKTNEPINQTPSNTAVSPSNKTVPASSTPSTNYKNPGLSTLPTNTIIPNNQNPNQKNPNSNENNSGETSNESQANSTSKNPEETSVPADNSKLNLSNPEKNSTSTSPTNKAGSTEEKPSNSTEGPAETGNPKNPQDNTLQNINYKNSAVPLIPGNSTKNPAETENPKTPTTAPTNTAGSTEEKPQNSTEGPAETGNPKNPTTAPTKKAGSTEEKPQNSTENPNKVSPQNPQDNTLQNINYKNSGAPLIPPGNSNQNPSVSSNSTTSHPPLNLSNSQSATQNPKNPQKPENSDNSTQKQPSKGVIGKTSVSNPETNGSQKATGNVSEPNKNEGGNPNPNSTNQKAIESSTNGVNQTKPSTPAVNNQFYTNFPKGNAGIIYPVGKAATDYEKQINKTGKTQCSADKPFFDGSSCISCTSPLLFKIDDGKCQTCPEGQRFDTANGNCFAFEYYSNLQNQGWIAQNLTIAQVQSSIVAKQEDAKYTVCPPETPFANSQGLCLKCETNSYFSFDSESCTQCQSPSVFDSNSHKCMSPTNQNYQTNPNTTKLIYNGKSGAEWANIYYTNIQNNKGIADCPESTPYFDGTICVDCLSSRPYFNLATKACQVCPSGTAYDAASHECVTRITNRPYQVPTFERLAAGVFA